MKSVVVLDFETTGVSPRKGDRAIEVGAVRIVEGRIAERFQALMNPGRRISPFIESYTGITNAMLADAPPCAQVMDEFADFIGQDPLVAHNASFDQRFLDAELMRIGRDYCGFMACTLLLSRRLFTDAPNHKLGTLVGFKQIENSGIFHRALADAEMTAHLWLLLLKELQDAHRVTPSDFHWIMRLSKQPKSQLLPFLKSSIVS